MSEWKDAIVAAIVFLTAHFVGLAVLYGAVQVLAGPRDFTHFAGSISLLLFGATLTIGGGLGVFAAVLYGLLGDETVCPPTPPEEK